MIILYENSDGEKLELNNWPIMIQNPESLFKNKWSYTEESYTSLRFFKEKQELSATLQIFAESEVDFINIMEEFTSIVERDVVLNETGRIWIYSNDKEDGYYLECNIIENDYTEYEEEFYTIDKKITIIASKIVWKKSKKFTMYNYESKGSTGIDYPYEYPYDYVQLIGSNGVITNENYVPCDFIISISGPAMDPVVVIGDNTYEVNISVETDDVLVINSKLQTIELNKKNGIIENVFSKRGRDNYIFEKIQEGVQTIRWNGAWNLEVELLIERSEPKWT